MVELNLKDGNTMAGAGDDWYFYLLQTLFNLLDNQLVQAVEKSPLKNIPLFFRADDIGVPGSQFLRLLELFTAFQVPLAMAMVPAWLTAARWDTIMKVAHRKSELWCWHQHGWRHANHETTGKKQEFGPGRLEEKIYDDLDKGRHRLKAILGNEFYPIFTPPWNRCDQRTLFHLKRKNYRAVSRFKGDKLKPPPGLPDLSVNVDLHTRKETDSRQAWTNLLAEFTHAFESGYCGIMLHHQRMSPAAFRFLEHLLRFVVNSPYIRVVNLRQMTAS